ncbi:MAG: hypothetical protein MH472_08230 [Bacteroidia bacterium]|nr:hypothetical protein [Bacteroidia bacterium]
MRKFAYLLVVFFIHSSALAQDKLVLKNRHDTLLVKVLHVSNEYVKYYLWESPNQVPIIYSKPSEVRKIVFDNGLQMRLPGDGFNEEQAFQTQARLAVKFAPLTLFRNMLSVQCEYALKPSISAEVSYTLVGYSNLRELPAPGNFKNGNVVRLGVKFISYSPTFENKFGSNHILEGLYVKPELVFLNLKRKNVYGYEFDEVSGAAAMVNFGKQWVWKENMVFDYYIGVGLGRKIYKQDGEFYYANQFRYEFESTGYIGYAVLTESNNTLALALQTGFRLGFLIGK